MGLASRPDPESRADPGSPAQGPVPSASVTPERTRNLGLVGDAALRLGTVTRSDLIAATGLSKATVARMVDDLTGLGILTAAAPPTHPNAPRGRGRTPDTLTVPGDLGHVIGVSFGIRRSVVLAWDLAGREIAHRSWETPPGETLADSVAWLRDIILAARSQTPAAPLQGIVVAVPARVVAGREISHPPASMSHLEGPAFSAALDRALGSRVVLESDAHTALSAILADEGSTGGASTVLLNMGTALTVSQRRDDGSTVEGRSSAFGDLSLIPLHTPRGVSTVGDLLSRHGLEVLCAHRGIALDDFSRLLTEPLPPARSSPSPPIADLLTDVLEAAVLALKILTVTIDPQRIIFAGRLVPLIERILPDLVDRAARELEDPPRLEAVALHGTTHSTAHGAARIALSQAHRALLARIAAGAGPTPALG